VAKEIERKWLVENFEFLPGMQGTYLSQGYIHSDIQKSVRVRVSDSRAWLTVKMSTGDDKVRDEFEYEIPRKDADNMIDGCDHRVEKERFVIHHNGLHIELDVFGGNNHGLMIAEIEFPSMEAAESFTDYPDWVGEEVTYNPHYINARLAKYPWPGCLGRSPHDEDY
jgi:adenylate cyclase